MDERSKVIVNSEVATRVIDGHTYVMDPDAGALHGLNEIGGFIWDRLDAGPTITELVAAVVAEYDVETGVALEDTTAFIELLESKGLLTVEPAA